MRLLFMGPPGAGKGTQAKIICQDYSIVQISTGDILRSAIQNGSEMGLKAKSFMDAGQLVPDEVVIGIVKDRLQEPDTSAGYILDGFPRTVDQASALKQMLSTLDQKLDTALNLEVPDEELLKRLLERARTEGRADDTEPVIRKRLENYKSQTLPLVDFYRGESILRSVDGVGSPEEITSSIRKILSSLRS